MPRSTALAAALFSAVLSLTLAPAAAARPTTKRQAELNVLRATHLLARWHVPAIDARTQTLRSNTVVRCVGRGQYSATRSEPRRYRKFVCSLRYRKRSIRLLYTTRRGRAFNLHRLARFSTNGHR